MKAIEKELDRLVQMLCINHRCHICGGNAEAIHHIIGRANKVLRYEFINLLPVVVIDKSMNDRRASTVRHNRARGSHSVEGMSDLVYQMLKDGWSDVKICNELGMEADELIRLKYVTGFAKLYEKKEYNKAWTPSHLKEEDFSEGDN